jgi:5-formyltetrahydrofolate cyclo-ligase
MAAPSDLQVAKQSLRDRMRATRPELAPAAREAVGQALAAALLAEPAVVQATQVALFAADATEPPTRAVFEVLGERGVTRLLPRVEGRVLVFARVEAWGSLAPGPFGILAPDPSLPPASLGPDDAVLVPGVAFDPQGRRLGRGGGFYDRAFPAERPGPLLIGVAFARQVVEFVPHDSRDRVMDAIVTEDGLRWMAGEARVRKS